MKMFLALAVLLLPAGYAAAGEQGDGLSDRIAAAVEDGTIKLSFRYRYEFVDEDGFAKDAHASTLRSRLSFAPKFGDDWALLAEIDDIRPIGNDTFNDTRNGKTDRPAVLDPEGTDLNQAWVRYTGFDRVALTLGRQRINRGNQRYIGGVGWRQNEQTYDSFSAAYGDAESPFQAFYAYVFNVRRIFGPERGTPGRELDSDSHLLDAQYRFGPALRLSGYAYLLDFDDADSLSSSTLGIRADGELALREGVQLGYAAEYARQEDFGDNPVNYDADYYLLEANLGWRPVVVTAGFEVLGGGSAPGSGFRTPLATLHKWQGWADRFAVATGGGLASGVEDLYLGIGWQLLDGKFLLRYHDFDAETGGGSLGSEWDASASWKFAKYYGLLLKFASYDADSFSADATKFWVMLTAAF
ncbi:MAG: hypothetical protein D6727_04925 [Gammaproteobacteria bacterium]|nr:MAG: hypothetical protein D6727_04925 [Gammaproteobacteria bacterium]